MIAPVRRRLAAAPAVALLLWLLGGCRASLQEDSNYAKLPPRAQARVRPFAAAPPPPAASADTLLRELTGADVRALSQRHAYTWVVTWAPWCEPWKQFVARFEEHRQRLAARDIDLVLVDIFYSPSTAMGKNDALRGPRPAYVVNWPYYGRHADEKFRRDLYGAPRLPKGLRSAAHFVFNRQQQLVLCAYDVDLPFEKLEQATAPGAAVPVVVPAQPVKK